MAVLDTDTLFQEVYHERGLLDLSYIYKVSQNVLGYNLKYVQVGVREILST